MRRHIPTLVVALLLVTAPLAAVAPVGAQSAGVPAVVEYGSQPSFVVTLNGDTATDDLRAWANETDARDVIAVQSDHDRAVVAAPPLQVQDQSLAFGLPDPSNLLQSGQLTDRPYISDIRPNYQLSYAEPVGLDNESAFSMGVGTIERVRMAVSLAPTSTDTAGLAFDSDAEPTTMADHRAAVGADTVSATGDGLTIAVLDTGTNTANGRLFGNGSSGSDVRILNASTNYVTGETVGEDGLDAVADGNGHGTWVASAAAANASGTVHDGIAPDADLLIQKVLDDGGSGSTQHIAEAIRDSADAGADVISMSLGSPQYDAELADAIAYAHDEGSVVVVAAGNSRQTVRWLASPADSDDAIAVGAVTGDEAANAKSAYFSQVGPDPGTTDVSGGASAEAGVDVAAPGMQTTARVATEGGRLTNDTLSGTSMATPMVAAAVGLGVQANGWTPDEAANWIADSSRPIPNASPTEVGAGMVATDNLVGETATESNQSDADVLTDAAERRQEFHDGLSDASGGFLSLLAIDPNPTVLEA